MAKRQRSAKVERAALPPEEEEPTGGLGAGAGRSAEPPHLFGLDLPEPIAAAARKIEALAGRPIESAAARDRDLPRIVGYFDERAAPRILAATGAKPSVAELSIEVLRLELRANTPEERMPYAEMRHETNQRFCRQLFRVMEQEILLSVAGSHAIPARAELQAKLEAELLEPLESGTYRDGIDDVLRTRFGCLEGLELMVSFVDRESAVRTLRRIANKDDQISRQLGYMYKVVENHRPFEGIARVRAAYYLAVPFLFDNRKPLRPTATK